MAVKRNPNDVAQKWARNLGNAVQDIQRGVQSVTDSPMEKAAAKKDKMLQRLTEAVQSGKWEEGLRRVSLQEWKEAFIKKGIPRIAQGAAASQQKMAEFMAELLPHIEQGRAQLQQMPDLTLEDSIARVTWWVRHMSQFKRK